MAAAGRTSGLVIQAQRSLGPDKITARHLHKLRRALPEAKRFTLLEGLALAPGCMQPALRALAEGGYPLGQVRLLGSSPTLMHRMAGAPGCFSAQAFLYGQVTYNDAITNARKRCLMTQAQEPVTISIRAKAGQRDLIDQAADRLGRSRSDFMLEAACRQAEDVLLDQTYFALDARSFAAFQTMLDKPPAPTDRLRRTLKARAPWKTKPDKAAATGKATGRRVR
jgi:uncharacterized protein (DUF1778 family)